MSSWMRRYTNGAALRGGWSFNQSVGLTSRSTPTGQQLYDAGRAIYDTLPLVTQMKLQKAQRKVAAKIQRREIGEDPAYATPRALAICIGLCNAMDSLRVAAGDMMQLPDVRKMYKARQVHLRRAHPGVFNSSLYRRVCLAFHRLSAADLAAARAPAAAPGPYVPFLNNKYLSAPVSANAQYVVRRRGQQYAIPYSASRWDAFVGPAGVPPAVRRRAFRAAPDYFGDQAAAAAPVAAAAAAAPVVALAPDYMGPGGDRLAAADGDLNEEEFMDDVQEN